MKQAIGVRRILAGCIAAGAAVAFAASAHAGSLMDESFSYPDGGLVAVSGGNWTTHSGTGTDIQVVSGTAVGSMASFPDDNRLLTSARTSTDKTYACFKLVVPSQSTLVCNYFAHFMVNSTTFRSKVFVTPLGGQYTVGLSVTANASGSPLAPPAPPLGDTWPSMLNYDQEYNIVISYNAVGGVSELWVDPVDESSPKITATDAPAGNGALTAFGLRESNTSGAAFTWIVDDLSCGTTFEDACGTAAQPEACCFADGGCVDLLADDCLAQGGTPQGEGTSCGTVSCPLPLEACCYADGSCTDLDANSCVASGGTPQGAGTACASTFCPPPTEACCYFDGSCSDQTAADCVANGGTPQGAGTGCATTFCPPPPPVGACCLADGSCVDGIYQSDCDAQGGLFYVGQLCPEITCVNSVENTSWGTVKGLYR
jgi:hypothetical protein